MKRDSTYMIESLNGALDGGCSDGQIWRGTTGGRRVAGWRMPGWRGTRLTATRKKEQPELQGRFRAREVVVWERLTGSGWMEALRRGCLDEGDGMAEGGWGMEAGFWEGWWLLIGREGRMEVGWRGTEGGCLKEGWMEGGLAGWRAGGWGLGLGLKVVGGEGLAMGVKCESVFARFDFVCRFSSSRFLRFTGWTVPGVSVPVCGSVRGLPETLFRWNMQTLILSEPSLAAIGKSSRFPCRPDWESLAIDELHNHVGERKSLPVSSCSRSQP